MKLKIFITLFIIILPTVYYAQDDIVIRKYLFNDGVYVKPQSLYYNTPDYTDFYILKNKYGDILDIEVPCKDDSLKRYCSIDTFVAFVFENSLYIKQASEHSFYRATIIGALVHFFDIEISYYHSYDDFFYYNYWVSYPVTERRKVNVEYVVELETGLRFYFNYNNFLNFLKERDEALYNELKNAKKKQKIIYNFLLRYNSRHPLPVPYEEF